jgi:hypothetical protein
VRVICLPSSSPFILITLNLHVALFVFISVFFLLFLSLTCSVTIDQHALSPLINRYYAICFLSQIVISPDQKPLANKLVTIYFSFFNVTVVSLYLSLSLSRFLSLSPPLFLSHDTMLLLSLFPLLLVHICFFLLLTCSFLI